MASAPLKHLVVKPSSAHTATVIFVHGLGDSGHGWKPVADMLARQLPWVKWVLPHAPMSPVTLNAGMHMPSWFDITTLDDLTAAEDTSGFLRSSSSLNQLVSAEVDAGVPSERIVVGGFSQGAAMSLLVGLTSERPLAGTVSLSGWLPLREKIKAMLGPHVQKLPIFMAHGTADPVVQYKFGELSREYLTQKLGFRPSADGKPHPGTVVFESYPGMQHSACDAEIKRLGEWLREVVPEKKE